MKHICQLCGEPTTGSYTERGARLPVCGECAYGVMSREEREIAERIDEQTQSGGGVEGHAEAVRYGALRRASSDPSDKTPHRFGQ